MNLKQYDVQYIYTWPFYARAIVIALLCSAIFFFAYLLDFSNFNRQSNTITMQTKDFIMQYQALIRNQARIEHEITQYSALEKTLNDWQNRLVPQNKLPDLLNDILNMGTDIGLQFTVFNPDEEKTKHGYHITPLQVVAEGSYHQVMQFLSQIADLPSIVVIGRTILKSEDNPNENKPLMQREDKISLTVTIDIYYLPNKTVSSKTT